MTPARKPKFFATPQAFRQWLEQHHQTADEQVVGFYKKESGRPSITWPESVDQALCFGWIDGVRHSIDNISYSIRFTPRKPRSIWSAVNIARARELIDAGLMQPAGRAAFDSRDESKTVKYSYERAHAELPEQYLKLLAANPRAHDYFVAQPPGYRKLAAYYVISAQKEETRLKRLQKLIEDSAAGVRIGPTRRP